MEWFRGFSQCWPPGSHCFVNWTAWETLVSVLLGALTIVVSCLAWMTSKRATQIADRAAEIAAQQHRETVDLRASTSTILGRMLVVEISSLPAKLAAISRALEAAVFWEDPAVPFNRIVNGTALEYTFQEAQACLLPSAEQVQERIHNLPDPYGADLASLIGAGRDLNDVARRIERAVRPPVPAPGVLVNSRLYAGDPNDFSILRDRLARMLQMSKKYANDFRQLVGTPAIDFTAKQFQVTTSEHNRNRGAAEPAA